MTAADSDREGARHPYRGWVIAGLIVLSVVFHQNIFDFVIGDKLIAEYGYCGDFESCAKASYDAGQQVPDDLANDCLSAHTQVVTALATKQNEQIRVGRCRVTGAVINGRLGAAFWYAW